MASDSDDAGAAVASTSRVRISGFKILLNERPEKQLTIRHCVNGSNARERVELEIKGSKVHEEQEILLDEFLDLREGSTLIVELYRKRRFHSDDRVAIVSIPFDEMRSQLESSNQRIEVIAKPKTSIWLIAELICTPQTSAESIAGKELPAQESESHDPNKESLEALEAARSDVQAAKQKLEKFKSLPGRGAGETVLKLGLVLSELHPVAKTVARCVNVVYEQRKAQEQSRELIQDLADSVEIGRSSPAKPHQ